MADMLDKYDVEDETTVPTGEPVCKSERQRVLKKKDLKALKKLVKALRKQNKLRKQEAARRKAEEEAAEEAAAAKVSKDKSNNGVRSFLVKLGDAICKAIPKVLTTLATLAFGFFFKAKFAGKAPQAA